MSRLAMLILFPVALAMAGWAAETGKHPRIACADEWRLGRLTFESRCSRCHGSDGGDTTYPNSRSLRGAGRRWSREEIRARLHLTEVNERLALIRGESYTAREIEALISYVAEL